VLRRTQWDEHDSPFAFGFQGFTFVKTSSRPKGHVCFQYGCSSGKKYNVRTHMMYVDVPRHIAMFVKAFQNLN